jgi:transposase
MTKVEILKYSVGIDVSKDKLVASLVAIDFNQVIKVKASRSFDNNRSGLTELYAWILKHHEKDFGIPISITMEATGVYHERCVMFLYEHQMKASVVLPNTAKKFMQSLNFKTKNDSSDAEGLARMGAERNLAIWVPISDNAYELRTMTRHYQSTTEEITQVSNQLHALEFSTYPAVEVKKSLVARIKFLTNQKDAIMKGILRLVKQDESLSALSKILVSAYGVGMLTASVLIAETNGFLDIASERQLVSYAGYDIVENQSGNKRGKTRISKKGNSHIRRAMYMPVLSLIKGKIGAFYALYERVIARTGIKMKALVAVQRKLLSVLFALVKKKQKFDRNYQPNWTNKPLDSIEITSKEEGAVSFLSALSKSELLIVA